jgi:hypothetical protein
MSDTITASKNKFPLMFDVSVEGQTPKNVAGIGEVPEITEARKKGINATEDLIKSLEARYAQPNLFNVAAGFLKPQLGGFAASLGSAGQALGENVENQRAIAPTIAKMRADLSNQQLGYEQAVAAQNKLKVGMKQPGGLTASDVSDVSRFSKPTGEISGKQFANETQTFDNMLKALQGGASYAKLVDEFTQPFVDKYYNRLKGFIPGFTKPEPGVLGEPSKAVPSAANPTEPPKAIGRTAIPGVDVDNLSEQQYRSALNDYNEKKQNAYKDLALNTQTQSQAGKKVWEISQQIHNLASSPSLTPIFAMYEKGDAAGTIGKMLESQSLSSTLANIREYAQKNRLGGGDALTKLNQLESLMGDLQNNMQNAVINPTDQRTKAEVASMPNLNGSQDAFLRNIRNIASEGLSKYENESALERAHKNPAFDPFYWTLHPESSAVNENATARRNRIMQNRATQDLPDFMKGSIDQAAFKNQQKKSEAKSSARMTAKEMRELANKAN